MGFKEAMQEYGKEITASFRCYDVTEEGSVDENSYVEYGDDSIVSMRFHYEGALLKSVMRCLDVEVKRDANSNIGINSFLKNVRFGVKAPGDADYSYKEYGTYIVKDMQVDEEQDTILLECYDLMLMSMVPYDLPYNDARWYLNDLLWDICARFGWERGFDNQNYANKNFKLEGKNLYDESYTFRDVLDDIAEATASIVAFVDDKLTIIPPGVQSETVDTSNLKSLKIGEVYGPINSVVLSRSPQEDNIYRRDEDSIAKNGLTEIRIENNPIIDHNRDGAMTNIFMLLCGLRFVLYDMESFGIGYIDLGDMFRISVGDKNHLAIMLCNDLLINQGVTEKCYVEAPAATETDYKAASTTDRMINQTVLKVNKQEQTITGLVSKTTALETNVGGISSTVTKMSELLMDEEKVAIKITEAIKGIDSVETSTGYTFDKDGLRIAKSDSQIENLIDNTGMYVKREGNEIVLQANQDGVEALNLTSRQFLIVGDNSRFENFNDGTGRRTACFYIGG